MSRSALATQSIAPAGLIPAYTTANAAGHSIRNRGNQFLHVKNGSGSSINVTLVTPVEVGGRAVDDDVIAVAAGAEKMIGPFDESIYNNPDGTVNVNFSAVATVTVAAFNL